MARQASKVTIISGIPPGEGGTGQLISHLCNSIPQSDQIYTKIFMRPERLAMWQILHMFKLGSYAELFGKVINYSLDLSRFWLDIFKVSIQRNTPLILLHPQNLGYRLTVRLINSRTRPTVLYLLDNSFFCVASYNHIKGENQPCIRCLVQGFSQVEINGCKPFPRPDQSAFKFAPFIKGLVKEGRLRIVAQNSRQSELAQRQFGMDFLPPVVGLWTLDWNTLFEEKILQETKPQSTSFEWDVLFHGHCLDAKGASWVSSLAAKCPEFKFMFPFNKPKWFSAPINCVFNPCTWDTGLRKEISNSRYVIVPSLWSAPIEGALIKSLACANAVLVVENSSSYSNELPLEIALRLSHDIEFAAIELKEAIAISWQPDQDKKFNWLIEFATKRKSFVSELLAVAMSE